MKRAERYAQVKALRDEGLTQSAIASRLGVSRTYVYQLLSDPGGVVDSERRARMRGSCVGCGAPTSYGAGGPSERCWACAGARRRLWDREAIIERIRSWAEENGSPPGARDWNPAMARRQGRPDIAARFYDDGCWPSYTTVQYEFGSWNAAIAAAGLTPRRQGIKRADVERYGEGA